MQLPNSKLGHMQLL